jgi:hypothetical protein
LGKVEHLVQVRLDDLCQVEVVGYKRLLAHDPVRNGQPVGCCCVFDFGSVRSRGLTLGQLVEGYSKCGDHRRADDSARHGVAGEVGELVFILAGKE